MKSYRGRRTPSDPNAGNGETAPFGHVAGPSHITAQPAFERPGTDEAYETSAESEARARLDEELARLIIGLQQQSSSGKPPSAPSGAGWQIFGFLAGISIILAVDTCIAWPFYILWSYLGQPAPYALAVGIVALVQVGLSSSIGQLASKTTN